MKINQWETKQLDDVATFSSGGTPSKEEANYWEGDYPWISAKDMKCFSIKDAGLKLTPEGLAVAKIAKKGSVLVLVRGMTLLKDLPVGYVERDVAFNQDIKALVAKSGVLGLFLAYALIANKNRILNLVNVAGHGTGRLDTTLLKEFPIDLPPLLEQCKIAEILGVWDESIDLLERLIGKTRSRKQGLMQQLLTGKKRFKEFEGIAWESYKQHQVAHFYNGRAYKLSEWEEAGTPVIRLQNLTGTGKNFYYSNLELPEHQYVNSGDLLYMWSATFGPHIWQGERAIYHYHIWKVVCNDNLLSKNFFYFLLDFETQQKMSKSNGMGIMHITKSTMESTQVILPSLPEQEKIAAVLSAADEEISTLEKQLAAYKQQKLGLMQQLLTGKIRVGMI